MDWKVGDRVRASASALRAFPDGSVTATSVGEVTDVLGPAGVVVRWSPGLTIAERPQDVIPDTHEWRWRRLLALDLGSTEERIPQDVVDTMLLYGDYADAAARREQDLQLDEEAIARDGVEGWLARAGWTTGPDTGGEGK